jgi:hypothetical protein
MIAFCHKYEQIVAFIDESRAHRSSTCEVNDDCCAHFDVNYFNISRMVVRSFMRIIISSYYSFSRQIACFLYCFACTSESHDNTNMSSMFIFFGFFLTMRVELKVTSQ